MAEELMIIDGAPQLGLRDAGRPVLWFAVKGLRGASLQIIEMKDIPTFLKKNDIKNINDLAGRAAVVRTDTGNGDIFDRLFV